MTEETKESFFKEMDLHYKSNNNKHHTSEISEEQLIVRRGLCFDLSVTLTEPLNSEQHHLVVCAMTGKDPSQDRGTLSFMSFPDGVECSPSAKAKWKMEIKKSSDTAKHTLDLVFTPPADAPIGEYVMCAKYREEEIVLAMLSVLFNPWCKDDSVYMPEEVERQEYVMNEQGVIFKGSGNYIFPKHWDFGQFEESMVNICMRMLDLSHKHMEDPVGDVAARYDPIYVSRVVSAMINSEDDHGVLQGNWSGFYEDGVSPSRWNGSLAILQKWIKSRYRPVKYGQCWVFAAVMCSVMRLLGIPCRVVTNFESAHDTDGNLIIDVYHADYGVREKESHDSVWNFHVWVEGWMKRPDLSYDGKYDGWQVVDPTPQELSGGVYCCGPASVKAILNGDVHLQYDVPFIFAEVNADCVDWLMKADGSQVNIWSDSKRVGQNISTKTVGSNKRLNITNTYKHTEGSDKERTVFKYACSIDYSSDYEYEETEEEVNDEDIEEENEDAGTERNDATNETTESTNEETPNETTERTNEETPNETTERTNEETPNETTERTNEETPNETTERTNEETPNETTERTNEETPNETTERTNEETPNETTERTNEETPDREPAIPPLSMHFTEETRPMNGKDVSLNLVLQSETGVARQLSINISVQAMLYNGKPAETIQKETMKETLYPGTDLLIPIKVPFCVYKDHMLGRDSMKISVLVTDNSGNTFMAEDDVVLCDPPISITVSGETRVNHQVTGEVIFNNPINEILTNCTLTFAGSGLLRDEHEINIPDLNPNTKLVVRILFTPNKAGAKTLMVDFDCSAFRDIQSTCAVNVAA